MAINGIGKQGADLQNLMQILEAGQAQSLNLAKKLIQISQTDKSLQNVAEGKGQNIDISA